MQNLVCGISRIRAKLILDPLDFLEYFCPDGTPVDAFFGHNELRSILHSFTVSQKFCDRICNRLQLKSAQVATLSPKLVDDILKHRMPASIQSWLASRGFSMDLAQRYNVTGLYPRDFLGQSDYWLFNEDELQHREYLLAQHGIQISIADQPVMVAPSYDRDGQLNCLAFRNIHSDLAQLCKWFFSHGRCATFGLDRIDHLELAAPDCYIVEGFFDFVAMREQGYVAVGLGSPTCSEDHWTSLRGLDPIFLFDSDETGRANMRKFLKLGHRVANMLNPAKDAWEAHQAGQRLQLETF